MYRVVQPNTVFKNKTYADYLETWWEWLYTSHCDRINVGDVAFLRGVAIGDDQTKGYLGAPVINVADNALRISKEQGVFFCNITSNAEAIYERVDYSEAQLRAQCTADLNQSTIPSTTQILIDGDPIKLPPDISIMDFRTTTSQFMLKVPDAQYGETVAPFMDVVLDPGEYRCVAMAYCFIIVFEPGQHTVYSVGRGKPWMHGEYISELLYEIEVSNTTLSGVHTETDSAISKIPHKLPISNVIYSQLDKMESDKLIDSTKLDYLKDRIKQRDRLV